MVANSARQIVGGRRWDRAQTEYAAVRLATYVSSLRPSEPRRFWPRAIRFTSALMRSGSVSAIGDGPGRGPTNDLPKKNASDTATGNTDSGNTAQPATAKIEPEATRLNSDDRKTHERGE